MKRYEGLDVDNGSGYDEPLDERGALRLLTRTPQIDFDRLARRAAGPFEHDPAAYERSLERRRRRSGF